MRPPRRCTASRTGIIALLAMVFALAQPVRAAHYSGGSITYECLGGNQYLFHLDLFLDCSGFQIVSQELNFQSDCGLQFTMSNIPPPVGTEVSQLCPAAIGNSTCNGGTEPGIMYFQFDVQVLLPPCDGWTVSWDICCRNTTINVNALPGMYIEATLNTLTAPCDNSPVFTDQSLPYVCANQVVDYNFGVTEPDGDSLVYALVSAQQVVPPLATVTYNPGYSGTAPIPGIVLDPVTGQLTFTPTLVGNYVVVVQVSQYDASGQLIGTVMRDILFVVMNCTNAAPTAGSLTNNTGGTLTGTNSIEVCEGEAFCVDLVFTDPDPGTVLQVISQAASLMPGSTVTITGTNPATATLCWTGDPAISPVNVLFEANDGTCPIMNTVLTAINIVTVPGGAMPDPGVDAPLAVCAASGPVSLFAALGGTPDPGGVWTGPGGAPHGPTFDPATDAIGTYTYTVNNACASTDAAVTVSISQPPNAGTNGSLTLCGSDPAASLFSNLGGTPMAGGQWSGPSAVVGGNYDPAIMVPGVYTYTVAGIAPCPDATATVTVVEGAVADAGSNGALTVCGNAGSVSLLGALGGAPQAGGAWSGPSPVVGGLYDAATMNPGAYTYTVTGGAPCPNDQSTVTVTENPAPDAGTNGALSLCSSDAPVPLFALLGGAPQAGGAWSGPSVVVGGLYDPAAMVPGAYTYTVTGLAPCANATATVAITESTAPVAGLDGTLDICGNAPAVSLFAQLGGAPQAGGAWSGPSPVAGGLYDPATMAPGAYTYTVSGVAPCANDQASVTVSEPAPPNAGADAATTVCDQGAPIDLFTLLAGAQPGGAWTGPGGGAFSGVYDPVVDAPGVHTYTVAGVVPCANDVATVNVVETSSPDAGADATVTFCSNGATTDLFTLLAGAQPGGAWTAPGGAAFTGLYDPVVQGPGVYTYDLVATAPCVSDQATVTVSEVVAPDAGVDGSISVCDQGAPVPLFPLLGGAQPGGAWTAPGGAAFSGTYDPLVDAPGVFTYTLQGTAPCVNDQSTVTVVENGSPYAGADALVTICSTVAPVNLFNLLGGAQTGGTWTGPLGVFSGTFDPVVDGSGVYTYALTATAPCVSDQATVTVNEEVAPDAGTDAVISACSSATPFLLFAQLGGNPMPGGTWTDPLGMPSNGVFDPAVAQSGTYTYQVTGVICPADQSTVTVTVTQGPDAGTGGPLAVCVNGGVVSLLGALGGTPDATGQWTDPGGNATSGQLDPSIGPAGPYTYTVQGTAGCPDATSVVNVTIAPSADAGSAGAVSLCSNGAAVNLFTFLGGTPDAGGTWTAPGGAGTSAICDPSVAASGLYTYTVAATPPCADAQATVLVTIQQVPDAGSDATVSWCSTDGAQALFPALGGTPQAGGAWTAPGGAVSSGSFQPGADVPGAYLYTVAGTSPCASDTAVVVVSVSQAVDAGSSGAVSACSNGAPVDLFAALGGGPQPGGQWTGPGGAVNAVVDPSAVPAGLYTYTVAAPAPCPAATATVQLTITAVPQPVITVNEEGGCAPLTLVFGTAQPVAGSCLWTLGNGYTSTQCGGDTVVLDVPGSYPLTLTIDAGNGCTGTVQAAAPVLVVDLPLAAFTSVPVEPTTLAPTVTFQNFSTGATAYNWQFADLGSTESASPTFTFPSAIDGEYPVCLTAFASPSCFDTACATIVVRPAAELFVPNAFTPDGDGVNDRFSPVVRGMDPEGQELLIMDRWGRAVFTTRSPGEGWDGTFANGDAVPGGVLVWRFEGRDAHSGARVERMGHVTLVR